MEKISAAGAANQYSQPIGEKESAALMSAAKETEPASIHEMIREAKEKADAQREKFKLKSTARYGDAPLEAYARLARAKTEAQVNSASGYARRQVMRLKAAMRQDSDNADRIKAAINQLQKAVTRAGKKKADLSREKLTQLRQKKAAEQKRKEEALRLKQELRRAQSARSIRESGYIKEAVIDNRLQDQLSATRMELRAQAQALTEAYTPSQAAIQQYGAEVPMDSPPPSEIVIEA